MKKNIKQKLFVGRPFPAGLMNAQKVSSRLINKWKTMRLFKNF